VKGNSSQIQKEERRENPVRLMTIEDVMIEGEEVVKEIETLAAIDTATEITETDQETDHETGIETEEGAAEADPLIANHGDEIVEKEIATGTEIEIGAVTRSPKRQKNPWSTPFRNTNGNSRRNWPENRKKLTILLKISVLFSLASSPAR